MDAARAFWSLSSLVSSPQFAFRDVFSAGLYRVGLGFHSLSVLLRRHNPRLAAHLASLGVAPNMYCAGWVMTLFSSLDCLPLPLCAALWDSFLLNGWKALWRCVLCLMDGAAAPLVAHSDLAGVVQASAALRKATRGASQPLPPPLPADPQTASAARSFPAPSLLPPPLFRRPCTSTRARCCRPRRRR